MTKGGITHIEKPAIEKDEDEDEEKASMYWGAYITNKSLCSKVFEGSSSNIMIITPGEIEKQKLLSKYKSLNANNVRTIYEAKGMEWDIVIMYNMFSSYSTYFLDMISESGKAKRSTIHRMTFNKYYVGCTRSTKNFVIVEDDEKIFQEENPIYQQLLSVLTNIDTKEKLDLYVYEDNTFAGWYRMAVQYLEFDERGSFQHAASQARRFASTPEEKKLVADLIEGNDPKVLEKYAFDFLNTGEYELAKNAFLKCWRISNENGPYIALCRVLEGKQLTKDHLKGLLRHKDIIWEYPEAIPKIIKQNEFKKNIRSIIEKLKK